jgi:hypothetical protein
MLPELYVHGSLVLPDNDQWQFRFQIKSESSDRLYTIAQHKKNFHWGCSCPGWKSRRNCKHLTALGIPGNEIPYEVRFIKS